MSACKNVGKSHPVARFWSSLSLFDQCLSVEVESSVWLCQPHTSDEKFFFFFPPFDFLFMIFSLDVLSPSWPLDEKRRSMESLVQPSWEVSSQTERRWLAARLLNGSSQWRAVAYNCLVLKSVVQWKLLRHWSVWHFEILSAWPSQKPSSSVASLSGDEQGLKLNSKSQWIRPGVAFLHLKVAHSMADVRDNQCKYTWRGLDALVLEWMQLNYYCRSL